MNHLTIHAVLCICLATAVTVDAADCTRDLYDQLTNDYYFVASSAQGAVGDVVSIDISVVIEKVPGPFISITAVVGYDSSKAELLGGPQHSEFFDRVAPISDFHSIPREGGPPKGFLFEGLVRNSSLRDEFPSVHPVYLGTVFFRVKGSPGDVPHLTFDELKLDSGACWSSYIRYALDVDPRRLNALSTRHVPGQIRVLTGEPTNPEPNILPLAKVYPFKPTPENAAIHFELAGGIASPEAKQVPLDLYLTSSMEWSGFGVSLRFPSDLVHLSRVEEHIRPGGIKIDNESGHFGTFSTNSRRRVGAEGERVKVATLYLDLLPAATEVTEVAASFESVAPYINWLEIYHQSEGPSDSIPISTQVDPLVITTNALKVQARPTVPGDVNLDYGLEITDAVAILSELFLGVEGVLCDAAADFNGDGAVNMGDPVGLLSYLYLGGPAESRDVLCTVTE